MTRPFETLEQMNETLVEYINDVVEPNDWLIHLGDWSFGGFEKIQEFRDQINCKNIVLILGNHDHHIVNNKENVRKLFSHVAFYEELKVTQSNRSTEKFVLCHYPIISWNGQHHGVRMLHGHQHLKGDSRVTQTDRMDVGVCGNPYFRPYHIEEVVQHLNQTIVNNEVVLK
jgi:calcineurin-like phosphoesterase family protein